MTCCLPGSSPSPHFECQEDPGDKVSSYLDPKLALNTPKHHPAMNASVTLKVVEHVLHPAPYSLAYLCSPKPPLHRIIILSHSVSSILGNHRDTANSALYLGNTQAAVGNHISALESHQRALDIRLKLLGDHLDTVTAYQAVIADLGKLGDMEKLKEMKIKCDEMQSNLNKKKSRPHTVAGKCLIN